MARYRRRPQGSKRRAKDDGSGEDEEGTKKAAGTPTNTSEETINDERRKHLDDSVENEDLTNDSVGAKDGGEDEDSTEKIAGTPTNPSEKPISEEERNQQGELLEKDDRTNKSAGGKDVLGEDEDSSDKATAAPFNPSKETFNNDERKQQDEQGEEEDHTNESESAKVGSGNVRDGTEKNKADGTPINPSTNENDEDGIEEAALKPANPSKKSGPEEESPRQNTTPHLDHEDSNEAPTTIPIYASSVHTPLHQVISNTRRSSPRLSGNNSTGVVSAQSQSTIVSNLPIFDSMKKHDRSRIIVQKAGMKSINGTYLKSSSQNRDGSNIYVKEGQRSNQKNACKIMFQDGEWGIFQKTKSFTEIQLALEKNPHHITGKPQAKQKVHTPFYLLMDCLLLIRVQR